MPALPKAHAIVSQPRKADLPDLYAEGRVCGRPRCRTILSIYNPGPLCWPCGGYDSVDTKPTGEALAELMAEKP